MKRCLSCNAALVRTRGCCVRCYRRHQRAVMDGKATWADLEARGLVRACRQGYARFPRAEVGRRAGACAAKGVQGMKRLDRRRHRLATAAGLAGVKRQPGEPKSAPKLFPWQEEILRLVERKRSGVVLVLRKLFVLEFVDVEWTGPQLTEAVEMPRRVEET